MYSLLALAGFDPQSALALQSTTFNLPERQTAKQDGSWTGDLFSYWKKGTHPSMESRLKVLEKELEGWPIVSGPVTRD
jgi:hypothetical protein